MRFWSTFAARRGLVTTGVSRCGIDSYRLSSTCLGSTSTIRTSFGEDRSRIDDSIALTQPDLPEPVVPATSRCGILARSVQTELPAMSLPSQTASGDTDDGCAFSPFLRGLAPR